MYCLDPKDKKGAPINKDLFGPDLYHKHRRLEINFLTCEAKQLTKDNFSDYDNKCLVDLKSPEKLAKKKKEILDYLGDPDIVMIYNNE
jgi:hypothetical protein